MANFMPPYSTWYPATSSDSASNRSKGERFNSAMALARNVKAAIGMTIRYGIDWTSTIRCVDMVPVSTTTARSDRIIGTS